MLGTRITSFAFGFACASGISMYKLKEDIWSSHKILADQVRVFRWTTHVARAVSFVECLTSVPLVAPD